MDIQPYLTAITPLPKYAPAVRFTLPDGRPALLVTSGHDAIGLLADEGSPIAESARLATEALDSVSRADIEKVMRAWATTPGPRATTLASLLTVLRAGEPCARCGGARQCLQPVMAECSTCAGDGEDECASCGRSGRCDDCGGKGERATGAQAMQPCPCVAQGVPVRLDGFVFNGAKAAEALGRLPDPDQPVRVGHHDGALTVHGDGWFYVLMGLRGHDDDAKTLALPAAAEG